MDDVGIPERLITDGAGEFNSKGKQFLKEARRMRIQLHTSKWGWNNQNHAEDRDIGFLAKRQKSECRRKGYLSGSGISDRC